MAMDKREYQKKYHKEHSEHIKAQKQLYAKAHKEQIATKQREYVLAHAEKTKEDIKRWIKANREAYLEHKRQYYMGHKAEISAKAKGDYWANRDAELVKNRENYEKHKAAFKLRAKKWQHENPDKMRVISAQVKQKIKARDPKRFKEESQRQWQNWYAKNKELVSTRAKERYAINPAAHREKARLWRMNNMERHLASVRAWKAAHPEQVKAYNRIKRYRKSAFTPAYGHFTVRQWAWLLAQYNEHCAYCQTQTVQLEPDHVIPIAKGGMNSIDNIVPACRYCNGHKSDSLTYKPPLRVFVMEMKKAA